MSRRTTARGWPRLEPDHPNIGAQMKNPLLPIAQAIVSAFEHLVILIEAMVAAPLLAAAQKDGHAGARAWLAICRILSMYLLLYLIAATGLWLAGRALQTLLPF